MAVSAVSGGCGLGRAGRAGRPSYESVPAPSRICLGPPAFTIRDQSGSL